MHLYWVKIMVCLFFFNFFFNFTNKRLIKLTLTRDDLSPSDLTSNSSLLILMKYLIQ